MNWFKAFFKKKTFHDSPDELMISDFINAKNK